MTKRFLALILLFFLLVSMFSLPLVSGDSKTVELGDGYYRYENDFNGSKTSIKSDPMLAFVNPDNFAFDDGIVNIDGSKWAVFSSSVLLGEMPYTVTLDVSAKQVNSAATCGAAFNVRAKKAATFMDQGITFIVRNNSLRIFERGNEIISFKLPFSFDGNMRTVWVEDNLSEIKFYANDDSKVKTLLASVEFANGKLIIKDGDGVQKKSRSDPGVPATGYFGFMSHFALTSFDNFSFEYYKKQYVPVDMSNVRDTFYDTWVATDNLGRSVPVSYTNSIKDKKVGIFYFLWHEMSGPLFDHYKAYTEGGVDKVWDIITQGDRGYGHYWAEPYFGYYRSDDEWIMRKHTNMLVNAGIDFIYFDMSNGHTYEKTYMTLLKVWKKMREEGSMTPQFVCFLGDRTDLGYITATELWNNMYMDGQYKDLWFLWEGKPLLLGNLENVSEDIKENFTIRRSWAFTDWEWYTESNGKGKWPWIALYPQGPGRNFDGIIEQMIVSCGFHSNSSLGRSYHDGKQPTDGKKDFEFELDTTPYGLAFQEQWKRALEINPPIVMITGWNEWWAGRWPNDGVGQKIANTYTIIKDDPQYMHNYVDCFNPEFSRDIEPMKGGFGDNYYYQMVNYIRQYKGARAVPVSSGLRTITINNDFSQWDNVGPEFSDTLNDTAHRDHPGNAAGLHYTNTTGRNDIDFAKVSLDESNVYFLVSTNDSITHPEGENWMNLLIDIDQDHSTGWEGYDFIINRSRTTNKVSVEKCVDNSWSWEKVYDADFVVSDKKLHLSIPLSVLNITSKSNFDFKWTDNSTISGNVMEFMDLGDSAPDDRFNFRFLATEIILISKTNINITPFIIVSVVLILLTCLCVFLVLRKKSKK